MRPVKLLCRPSSNSCLMILSSSSVRPSMKTVSIRSSGLFFGGLMSSKVIPCCAKTKACRNGFMSVHSAPTENDISPQKLSSTPRFLCDINSSHFVLRVFFLGDDVNKKSRGGTQLLGRYVVFCWCGMH